MNDSELSVVFNKRACQAHSLPIVSVGIFHDASRRQQRNTRIADVIAFARHPFQKKTALEPNVYISLDRDDSSIEPSWVHQKLRWGYKR